MLRSTLTTLIALRHIHRNERRATASNSGQDAAPFVCAGELTTAAFTLRQGRENGFGINADVAEPICVEWE